MGKKKYSHNLFHFNQLVSDIAHHFIPLSTDPVQLAKKGLMPLLLISHFLRAKIRASCVYKSRLRSHLTKTRLSVAASALQV